MTAREHDQPRVLLVGWDAADHALIEAMLAAGELPALASLRARGVHGRIEGLPGLGDDALWASFSTGVPPGTHGRFHRLQLATGTYHQANVRRTTVTQPPFWRAVAEAGLTVVAVDVPKSPLAGHANAREVVDWMPHGADAPAPTILPRGTSIGTDLTPPPGFACHQTYVGHEDTMAHLAAVSQRLALRSKLLTELLTTPWDLFIAVVAETHCAGHHAWHLHDPAHPLHRAWGGEDPVRRVYREADARLGEMLALVDPATEVVVLALNGMGPNNEGALVLDEILERLDAEFTAPHAARFGAKLAGAVPRPVRAGARRLLPGTEGAAPRLRMAGRRAFALRHDAVSAAIRINLRGREPGGTVAPGAQFEATCRRLAEQLLAIREATTGAPVFSEVIRTADAYPGPRSEAFADLLAVWSNAGPIMAVRSPSIGRVTYPTTPQRSGNHRVGGWYTATGPGVVGQLSGPTKLTEIAGVVQGLLGVDASARACAPADSAVT